MSFQIDIKYARKNNTITKSTYVYPDTTVSQLKENIEQLFNIETDDQLLIHLDRSLVFDTQTMAGCGLYDSTKYRHNIENDCFLPIEILYLQPRRPQMILMYNKNHL